MVIVFTEITGFVYKNAKLFQYLATSAPAIKKTGNFPALDGPGSYDQPK